MRVCLKGRLPYIRHDKERQTREKREMFVSFILSFVKALRDSSSFTFQVSGLRINDSGTYRCLVQTVEEADYKTISLSVEGKH